MKARGSPSTWCLPGLRKHSLRTGRFDGGGNASKNSRWHQARIFSTPRERPVSLARSSLVRIPVSGGSDLEPPGVIVAVGKNTLGNAGTLNCCSTGVEVGDDVLISFGVMILAHDGHSLRRSERRDNLRVEREGHICWDLVDAAPVNIADGV